MKNLNLKTATDHPKRSEAYSPGILFAILSALLLWSLAGCTGYRLGSTLPPHIRSVYVPSVQNRTGEPDIESAVTRELLREFQRDGTLRLELEEFADTVVRVTVLRYHLQPMLFGRDDVQQAVEYRLQIQADIEFVESATGAVLLSTRVEGESAFPATMDVNTARRNALEPTARDLAREIVSTVISTW